MRKYVEPPKEAEKVSISPKDMVDDFSLQQVSMLTLEASASKIGEYITGAKTRGIKVVWLNNDNTEDSDTAMILEAHDRATIVAALRRLYDKAGKQFNLAAEVSSKVEEIVEANKEAACTGCNKE